MEPTPKPYKEDLLTRIKDQKGKPRKLMVTPIPLHSLITVQPVKLLPKRYAEEDLNDCKAGISATGSVRVLKPLIKFEVCHGTH